MAPPKNRRVASLHALLLASAIGLTACGGDRGLDARDLTLVVQEDGAVEGTLTGPDAVLHGVEFALEGAPAHGVVTVDRMSGAFRYVPAPDFHGADAFTFRTSSRGKASDPATVSLEVLAVNDPPVGEDQSGALLEDAPHAGQLVASDVDGDPLTYTVVEPPRHGTVTVDGATGAFEYVPRANYFGRDTFRWVASDGVASTRAAAVALVVTPMNDPPVPLAQSLALAPGGVLVGTLWADDVDGELVSTFALASAPAHGTVQLTPGTPTFTYTPNAGYVGDDAFRFFASDGQAVSRVESVSVHVRASAPTRPQVQLQVGRVTVAEGESAVLGVTGSGAPGITFRWRRKGVVVTGAYDASYVTPPLSIADSGTSYAVTVYAGGTSTTSLSWVVNVVERRPDQRELVTLYANRPELYPSRQPLAIKSVAPLAGAVGARVTFDVPAGQVPPFEGTGDASFTPRSSLGALDVLFADSTASGAAALALSPPDGSPALPLAIKLESAADLAARGVDGPPRLTFTEFGVPFAYSAVEDWMVRPASTTEVAFAEATWGAVVAAETGPTAKAQALAKAIMTALEPSRGVPSDAMRAPPFEQYQRAVAGLDQVWCSNIAQIFSLACNALGIPSRILALARTQELGSEYDLLTAEGHNTTEIFDAERNAWVWIDATSYMLSMELPGIGLLNTVELQRALADPTRLPLLTVLEYDPVTGQAFRRDSKTSLNWGDLDRFFNADTGISIPRKGRELNIEFHTDEGEVYPQLYDVALRSVRELPDDFGVALELGSALPGPARYELWQTYASWGVADRTVRTSTDGRFELRFPAPHEPVVKAMLVKVRAVAASGATSVEHVLMLYLYNTEFYASRGLTTKGLVIFTRGTLPLSQGDPADWLLDQPSLDDYRYAAEQWGSAVAGEVTAVGKARRIAAEILRAIGDRRGSSGHPVASDPLGHHRRVVAGLDVVDDPGLARILVRACNASGVAARLVEMNRVLGRGAGYDVLGVVPRTAAEVFDPVSNRWAVLDPAAGLIGADLAGYGALNAAELARVLEGSEQIARLTVEVPGPGPTGRAAMPASSWTDGAPLRAYFAAQPVLGFERAARR